MIKIKSKEQFDLLTSGAKVVVKFGHDQCKPCVSISPIFERLAQEHPDIKFIDVDVTKHNDIAHQWAVRSVPTIAIFSLNCPVWIDVGSGAIHSLKAQL